MKYLHTMLRVSNLERALEFWCDQLGMVETNRFDNDGGRFTLVFLAANEDEARGKQEKAPLLELTYNWPDENTNAEVYSEGRSFGHLAFVVDDIYATCQRLMDAGVVINRPPRDGHMAFVRSPDNQSIELLQKGDSLVPKAPWDTLPNVGHW
ncbi:MAG: VOC family protein [Granulosicoccus sp.]